MPRRAAFQRAPLECPSRATTGLCARSRMGRTRTRDERSARSLDPTDDGTEVVGFAARGKLPAAWGSGDRVRGYLG